MQEDGFNCSKLIVSWNRYEQSLMKRHLMNCANSNDIYCFGDFFEVHELHQMLKKHGILQTTYDYQNIGPDKLQNLVSDIKKAIKGKLKAFSGETKHSEPHFVNNDEETKFLTSFAMAIQDTKKRRVYFPNQSQLANNGQKDNIQRMYFGNFKDENYISIPKLRLFALATQLSRIGINCTTTAKFSSNMRGPMQGSEKMMPDKKITLIDTNNFLELYNNFNNYSTVTYGNFNRLDIRMDGFNYYVHLYQKLFDFALKKTVEDYKNGKKLKWPEFTIPLGSAWGEGLNDYIFAALNEVLGRKYNRTFNSKGLCFKDLIKINFIDSPNDGGIKVLNYINKNQNQPGNINNLKESDIDICDYTKNDVLFSDDDREQYVIMAGDHCAFLGNEALHNGLSGDTRCTMDAKNPGNYNNSSMEGFNMKTDFHKFYGQGYGDNTGISAIKCGFNPNNGAWISNPENLNMPTKYILHMNYNADKMVEIDEKRGISKEINNKPVNIINKTVNTRKVRYI